MKLNWYYPQVNISDTTEYTSILRDTVKNEIITTTLSYHPSFSVINKFVYYYSNNRIDSIYKFTNFLSGKFMDEGRLDTLQLDHILVYDYDENGQLKSKAKVFQNSKFGYRNLSIQETYSFEDQSMKVTSKKYELFSGCIKVDDKQYYDERIYQYYENKLIQSIQYIERERKNENSNWRIKRKRRTKFRYKFK